MNAATAIARIVRVRSAWARIPAHARTPSQRRDPGRRRADLIARINLTCRERITLRYLAGIVFANQPELLP